MIDQQPITFRPATTADAGRIAALFTDEGYPAAASTISDRIERFCAASGQVIVAEDAGEILGFVAVHVMPRFEHDDTIARILALVVDAGARGRGVGHDLMAAAERVALENGAAFIEVTAAHHRPEARHLYEAVGYDATVTAYLRKRL
jgi:GNAT superfamily N-acetyltransferase